MAKNLLHCETGFGVYRSTQLGHIPFFFFNTISVGWPKYSTFLCGGPVQKFYCLVGTVAAVEISDRKHLNTLYKFRNLISVNRIFIKDYKVSVSI
jgi:hypothetical protein